MGKGNCKTCKNLGCASRGSNWTPNPAIECFGYEPRTNADRIRQMSDEELAKKISGIEQFALATDGAWSPEQWLDWLKQPEESEVDNG